MADLLVCSNEEQLRNLKSRCGRKYIVATLKYAFFAECRQAGETVIYMEPDELSDCNAIWDVIDKICNVINECDVEKKYLYRVSYHVEGGLPSAIDRILQNIRLIRRTVCDYKIEKVFLVDDKENWMINEALFLFAYNEGMGYQILDESGEREQECLFTLRRSKYNPNVKESRFDTQGHCCGLEHCLQQGSKRCVQDTMAKEVEIGFLYAARNNGKHFKWLQDDIQLYADHFNVEIISFYHSDDNERFMEKGISVECMEDYFDRGLFEKNYSAYLEDCRHIADKLNQNLNVISEGVDLSEYLKRKVINYLERDCLDKLYIDTCSNIFFRSRKYKWIRSWGNTNFWQSSIMYANSRIWNTHFFRREAMGPFKVKEYEPYANEIYTRIWYSGELHKHQNLKDFDGKIYYLPDYNWGDFARGESENKAVAIGRQVHILFAPSHPLVGYSTVKSFVDICTNVLERMPSEQCKVTLKNHPNIDAKLQFEIEEKCRNKKYVECIDKMDSIWLELENCDIVITNASTVILDAIKAGKPVFCIAACQDYELIRHHEGNIRIYQDVNRLCDDLQDILSDRAKLERELTDIVNRQNNYIRELVGDASEDGYEKLYDIIREGLKG